MPQLKVIIASAITTTLLAIVIKAAQRGRPAVVPESGNLVFRHHFFFRLIALTISVGAPIAITALYYVSPPKNESDILIAYLLFLGLGLPLLWETMWFSLVVGPDGLDCRSPWQGRQFIEWGDVKDLSFNRSMNWFVIRATGGRTFRVPAFVSAVSTFLHAFELALPPGKLRQARPGYVYVGRVFPGERYSD